MIAYIGQKAQVLDSGTSPELVFGRLQLVMPQQSTKDLDH